ncbi:endonuclease III domain-containing protein [Staphylococcus lugdunensis]|jgi:endonuclease-3 related protein|uniref:endonuclease III domain-containing protein n=1 Tax=Staphylococcus lugdunensis TaxID=28035 RepID=UPI00055A98B4|nr:endonuclease III [Staphylococcus lugdunensis]MCH8647058.1 endonuclease III domain-containing protein [Staphylococcus lugdunensis]MCI2844688.1 endonuclease III domain-containing protein [Staphylococcus lugdunensis]MDU4768672.1 endonuclease III domain-containing protein [Staphylococcus lugdunensis]
MNGSDNVPTLTTEQLYNKLFEEMGPQAWWPAETPEEMIAGAILVQNTAWNNAHMALLRLKEATQFQPQSILSLSLETLQRIIRPSGFYRNKAKALHELFSWLHMYHFDYEHIAHLFDKRLRDELLAIKGIGSETADVLMVYIFNGVEFIPDSYTRRLYHKLGYQQTASYDKLKQHITLPVNFTNQDANEFHALLDNFGKNYFNSSNSKKYNFLDEYFEQ